MFELLFSDGTRVQDSSWEEICDALDAAERMLRSHAEVKWVEVRDVDSHEPFARFRSSESGIYQEEIEIFI
jgi:hypothetical protein